MKDPSDLVRTDLKYDEKDVKKILERLRRENLESMKVGTYIQVHQIRSQREESLESLEGQLSSISERLERENDAVRYARQAFDQATEAKFNAAKIAPLAEAFSAAVERQLALVNTHAQVLKELTATMELDTKIVGHFVDQCRACEAGGTDFTIWRKFLLNSAKKKRGMIPFESGFGESLQTPNARVLALQEDRGVSLSHLEAQIQNVVSVARDLRTQKMELIAQAKKPTLDTDKVATLVRGIADLEAELSRAQKRRNDMFQAYARRLIMDEHKVQQNAAACQKRCPSQGTSSSGVANPAQQTGK